jgi:hypothetical protein
MIVVTGTRRAGTSMWMQMLAAAGYPVIGAAFPGDWGETLRSANPHGFYESLLRHGIYYRTNPHPVTGEYVTPGESIQHAVKVFIPGLLRSDASFLHRVIVTVRPWREYVASIGKMLELERSTRAESDSDPDPVPIVRMPPALEWWEENFALVRDIAVRGYACHVQSYDGVLADPRGVLQRTLAWIGREGDVEAAVRAVQPATRHERRPQADPATPDPVAPHVAAAFDAFYEAVHEGRGLEGPLIARMNAINLELSPEILRHRERVAKSMGLAVVRPPGADEGPFAVLDGEWA